MSQAETPFIADVAWRVVPPPRRDGPRLLAAIVIAILLELGVLGLIWVGRSPQTAPQAKEIPVEIIVEKPPPPPPPPPQAQKQEYIKPAIDAPREGKSDHDDEHVADKPKPAKAPPPPPAPPQPSPSPTPAKPPEPTPSPPTPSPEASKAAPAPAPEAPQSAEPESPPPQKSEPVETPAPAPAEKAEPVKTPAPEKAPPVETPAPAAPSVAQVLAKAFEPVPDVDFGGAAMRAPVSGGAARANYMSELYGLIVPRLRVPAIAHAYGRRLVGKIGFVVDGRGRLTQRYVEERSGSMELDEAALEAVGAASHAFPPPPHKQPLGITFTYSVQ
jgi:TonB family protein